MRSRAFVENWIATLLITVALVGNISQVWAQNAPLPRSGHTAVWTGTEMIVWGGQIDYPFQYANTGGRYNPVLDEWAEAPTNGAPGGRIWHTAVWTGSEMIIWGGHEIGDASRTGGRYNPTLNIWTEVSTNGAYGLQQHAAVWTGTEMIVAGGVDTNQNPNAIGARRYNPLENSWTYDPAPYFPYTGPAVWTGSEMVILGEWDSGGVRYNPETGAVGLVPAGTGARFGCTLIWTGSEIIVWGGKTSRGVPFNTGGRYNLLSNAWTYVTNTGAPIGRSEHTAVWTGTEMIIWGGYRYGDFLNSGGRYNPTTDTWTPVSLKNAPEARTAHTAVWTGTEMIIWGGGGGELLGSHALNTGGRYNPLTDTWRPTATNKPPSLRIVSTSTNMVLLTWPTNAQRFTLQYTTNLPGSLWFSNPTSPSILGGQYVVTNTVLNKRQFFRLKQ